MFSAQKGAQAHTFTIMTAMSAVCGEPRKAVAFSISPKSIRYCGMWPKVGLYIKRHTIQATAAGMA